MLEKEIEKAVKVYARTVGILAYKWTSPAHIGVPDGIFISPQGQVFFVEFKRQGGRVTPSQQREIDRLRTNRCHVYVVDNVEDGKKLMDTYA